MHLYLLCICLIPFSAVTCLYSVFHMLAPERAQCNSTPFKHPSEGCTRAAAGRAGSRHNKLPGLLYHGGSTPTPTAPSTTREEGGPIPQASGCGFMGNPWNWQNCSICSPTPNRRAETLHFKEMLKWCTGTSKFEKQWHGKHWKYFLTSLPPSVTNFLPGPGRKMVKTKIYRLL